MFPVGKASGGEFFAAGRVKGFLEYEGKRMGVEPEDCDGMTFHWLLKKNDMGREWRVSRKIIMLRAFEGLNGWRCI